MLRNIEIRLNEGPDGEGGTQWFGSFDLPGGGGIEEGGRYLLRLEDGRTGEIVVENAEPRRYCGRAVTVSVGFVGVGPLGSW